MTRLVMRGVSFRHPAAKDFRLQPVDLTLSRGLYYLLGGNGSGKTTLLKGLAGILPLAGGDLRLMMDNKPLSREAYKRYMGYSPQEVSIHPQLTVCQYLKYVARMRLVPEAGIARRMEELLQQFGLSEAVNSKTCQLSAGMKKRLMLAQAMLADPRLLLVDEPFAHLDIEGQGLLRSWLSEEGGRRIIIAAHHPAEHWRSEEHPADCLTGGCCVLMLKDGRLQECRDSFD